MDSIIYEICEMIISKNDTKKSIEFNEKFDAAQLKYDKLMICLTKNKQPPSTNMRLLRET